MMLVPPLFFIRIQSSKGQKFQQVCVTCYVQDMLFEEKNRLGSSPPRCYNKCNDCHPCIAVQVPSLPSHKQQLQLDFTKKDTMEQALFDPSSQVNNNSQVKLEGSRSNHVILIRCLHKSQK
ncbi:hypothetical protein Lalb_Chr12g0203921 [Lupinus albus]|uniref:Uncharacterized protein n=1 Tax=Lupinus albus TaxID=3870 RepID=A0A6A4PMW8_LUPAL|nr:hypothetical protein Lalb_Chr12g0203921 [Lupinus albus]